MEFTTLDGQSRASVLIPTYNRARDLRDTLGSLAGVRCQRPWEVIVIDNNSSDDTRKVVEDAAHRFPMGLSYVFEREQGRCAALNAGIAVARGEVILTTDDDVRFEPDWIESAIESLNEFECDYTGGKVLPIWSSPRPSWIPNHGGRHWAVLALLDYGNEPIEFGRQVPLGVNMAFRRRAFSVAGLWDNRLGRKAGTLLGQEVREWGLRARAAGLKGVYSPHMVIHHVIPSERLTKSYFRRWFHWHGISRAMLYDQSQIDMESPEATRHDYSKVPHIAGVPRYLYRTCARSFVRMLKAAAGSDPVARFENELWLWFFAGIVKQRWQDRRRYRDDIDTGQVRPA